MNTNLFLSAQRTREETLYHMRNRSRKQMRTQKTMVTTSLLWVEVTAGDKINLNIQHHCAFIFLHLKAKKAYFLKNAHTHTQIFAHIQHVHSESVQSQGSFCTEISSFQPLDCQDKGKIRGNGGGLSILHLPIILQVGSHLLIII